MDIYHYETSSGKDLIFEYIDPLPKNEKAELLTILDKLKNEGTEALAILKTRQIKGKLWEIKASGNRFMYVLINKDKIYILHACKKQKGKAELFELRKAYSRTKELEKELKVKLL